VGYTMECRSPGKEVFHSSLVLHSFGKTVHASAYLFVDKVLIGHGISAQKPLALETHESAETCFFISRLNSYRQVSNCT
jgi:hypothetical protein